MDAEDTMATENKYIYNSSGIIFLMDPLQIPDVRLNLNPKTPLPNENTEAEDMLARTANLIRKANNLKPDGLIDIPVAVAFSKIDALDSILDPSTCLNYPSKHTNFFDTEDFQDVNSEMESLVKEWSGDSLIQQLKHNFKEHAFFGLTSLGCNPHGSQKISKLRPRRVEDPFLWLLWNHKLVKDNRKSRLKWLKGIFLIILMLLGSIFSYSYFSNSDQTETQKQLYYAETGFKSYRRNRNKRCAGVL